MTTNLEKIFIDKIKKGQTRLIENKNMNKNKSKRKPYIYYIIEHDKPYLVKFNSKEKTIEKYKN